MATASSSSTSADATTTADADVVSRLRLSYAPQTTRHREREYGTILEFFEARLATTSGGSLYVCGAPGTGKTLHVERARDAAVGESKRAVVVSLRGTAFGSGDAFARAVGAGACPKLSWSGLGAKEALARLAERCGAPKAGEKRKRDDKVVKIVVVDEIDSLVAVAGDALRRVFRIASAPGSRLALVGIANAADVPRRAFFGDDAAYAEDGDRVVTVVFRPYGHAQLVDIVAQRAGEAVFARPALEFCARKVAATTGDARRALDVCRRALAIRDADGAGAPVTLAQAARAVRETLGGAAGGPLSAVPTLPHHAHVALHAALGLAASADDKAFSKAGLRAAYARACPNVAGGLDVAAAADDSLGLLVAAGLVGDAPDKRPKKAKLRNPGQAKLRVLVDVDDARRALQASARTSALAARAA